MRKGDECKSVMLTEQLSTNDDLVESLDTEPVFDYLLQHGVLNTDVVDGICLEETKLGRNSALLQHLDDNGNTAKALFINALRQSGQHKLASTIDTSQRIKPVYGTGYWDKPRHKGEVKIKICIKALKLLVPKTDSPPSVSRKNCVASATPQRLHKSYENMLMLDSGDFSTRSVKILDYAYDKEEEEEKLVKKSCWCMCFPMFCRPKHKKEKKYEKMTEKKKSKAKNKNVKKQKAYPESRRQLDFSEKSSEYRKSPAPNNENPNRSHYPRSDITLSTTTYEQRRNSGSPRKEIQTDIVGYKNNRNDSRTSRNVRDKENVAPVIMQYDNLSETVELRRPRDENISPHKVKQTPKQNNTNNNGTSSTVEMCEKWKSSGKLFEEKLVEFCALFELKAMQNAVTMYFEQDRGTLFFQTGNDGASVFICNICMSRKQVEVLKKDYNDGKIQSDLQNIILANDMQVQLDVLGMEISTVIDDDQFANAMEEL
ncbi:uncharacterized protein LOC126826881 isoform X2 [Patella vulgata]|uniref:uncharacterized protein LOC126826881 isoform X2 n=1 Tax=Patella vulgata TaxID=6465 RepID=UPI00217F9CF6|nr:uncharacterized protein LOC126826881 isoform X2 [Patella vulgata]